MAWFLFVGFGFLGAGVFLVGFLGGLVFGRVFGGGRGRGRGIGKGIEEEVADAVGFEGVGGFWGELFGWRYPST